MTLRRDLARRAHAVRAEQSGEVLSPCVSVCRMDADSRYCAGCLRTLDEIAAWGSMPADERRTVWARIQERIAEESP